MKGNKNMNKKLTLLTILCVLTTLVGCSNSNYNNLNSNELISTNNTSTNEKKYIPSSNFIDDDTPWYEVNDNIPLFTNEDKKSLEPFEIYSDLDDLGRCGVAYANICKELMPTEERGEIGSVKPTGWHTVKYNGIVDGNYLYNRCHLIGFQLAGENANEKNLITGTRYLNIQ